MSLFPFEKAPADLTGGFHRIPCFRETCWKGNTRRSGRKSQPHLARLDGTMDSCPDGRREVLFSKIGFPSRLVGVSFDRALLGRAPNPGKGLGADTHQPIHPSISWVH
jgi:hypothetical protein